MLLFSAFILKLQNTFSSKEFIKIEKYEIKENSLLRLQYKLIMLLLYQLSEMAWFYTNIS